ncbi:uncharacterized protein LOC124849918 isoform X2 [Scophthalmus maximus]|uniref:uncharacterized protein LOC124849918 isoform X2 n=1 Tax=Scophthalmus maximus TaxID=52904 RepID=UPI001FA8C307|nr:uncharacterized protein LOC124849918 isoform X2 [Scophthalmus maximus]
MTVNTITFLLCALARQAISQPNDISPARVLSQQTRLSENSDLYVTCSTFGLKKPSWIFVYLCKDGVGIRKMVQKADQIDSTFIVSGVGPADSGNYSCCYSSEEYAPSEVAARGHNIIQILVIANFLPAHITLARPSAVSEGDAVEFRCTVPDTLQTLCGCQLIPSYLRKNETILQVQAFHVKRMETTFTIERAVARDSGPYTCVVLPSACIREHENTLNGSNAVLLEVKASVLLRVIVSCGVITLLLMGLLWIANRHDHFSSYNPGTTSQQADTDMWEEEQEQTEGDYLEAEDGESLRMEEEEEYQNEIEADEFFNGCDTEGEAVYSVPDDSPSRASWYAASFKKKKHMINRPPGFTVG